WNVARRMPRRLDGRCQGGDDHVCFEANQFCGLLREKGVAAFGRAHFQLDVLALDQAGRRKRGAKPLQERFGTRVAGDEDANGRHPRLLRARRKRPHRRTGEKCDELATAAHSITSSARARSVGGTSKRSARAVLRLITSSNLVACMTGRSIGLAPLST